MIIAALCTIAWSNIAGMRSVAWTDAFQALIMIATSAAVLGVVAAALGGFGSFFSKLESAAPGLLTVPTAKGGFIVCVILFIGVSLATKPPKEKAEEFIGYLQKKLEEGKFI